jgi:Rps23 Pro-64 3,4-dihydroxylase Tpa1-like proline 4-hydroxylase
MKINKYENEIYEIEDFISDKEIELLFSFFDKNDEKNWWNSHPGHTGSINEKIDLIKEVGQILENQIKDYFTDFEKLESIIRIKRLKAGEFMHGHTDSGHDGKDKTIRFGIVIYLNDDFEGGEIYYKDFDLKIKPKKGSLIIHKSSNFHEVLKVLTGVRYSITTFVYGNEQTEFIFK